VQEGLRGSKIPSVKMIGGHYHSKCSDKLGDQLGRHGGQGNFPFPTAKRDLRSEGRKINSCPLRGNLEIRIKGL
jgi:hypothetical protein